MNQQYLSQMLEGLATSLQLTGASMLVGCILSLLMTITLILRLPVIHWFTRGLITLFTGTPLLAQIFLVYYGPGQFDWIRESFLWTWLSQPLVLCNVSISFEHRCIQHATVQRCIQTRFQQGSGKLAVH